MDDKQIMDLLKAFGKEYKSAPLPIEIEFGSPGTCFDWCVMQVSKYPRYRYVEGFTTEPNSTTPVLHAWLTDGTHAFDPTWRPVDLDTFEDRRVALPCTYIGIEMDIEAVLRFMKATMHQGVLANRWRSPELADKAIGVK